MNDSKHEPFDLNDNKDSEDELTKCPICVEDLNKGDVVNLSCGHSFHALCVVEWFRRKGSCPMCRDSIDPEERKTYTNLKARFKLMMRLSKRKNAPRELKALVRIHKRKMENLKKRRKEFREWKKTEDGLKYKELYKIYRKLQTRTWEWRCFSSRRCVERQIAQYPVVPFILRKEKKN